MFNTISTIDMLLKEDIGLIILFMKFKLKINQIKLSRLLDGILRMEELKRISRLMKLDQDFSTLLELFLQAMVLIRVSKVL
jgi:hypothetical protein